MLTRSLSKVKYMMIIVIDRVSSMPGGIWLFVVLIHDEGRGKKSIEVMVVTKS